MLARDHFGIKPLYYARSTGGRVALRVGDQGGARRPRARHRARPPVAVRLPAARPPRPQAPDRLRRHPCARRGHVGGGRRRRRARADLLDAHPHHRRRTRPGRVPRPLRAVGRAPAGRRRARRHLPLGRDRLVVDRGDGLGPAARTSTCPTPASLGDHLKTFSIVYDGDPIDEREYMDAVLAEVDAEPAFAEPTSEEFIDEVDQHGVAPGRADRVDRPVRAVVRHAAGAAEGHGAAQRAGRRRAARRVTCPTSTCTCASCCSGASSATFAREAWASRDVLKPLIKRRLADRRQLAADQAAAAPRALRRPRAAAASSVRRTT